jgi:large subunit ribosomal protein L25
LGKGASRRLRHSGKIPAVVYGAGQDPVSLTLDHNEILHAQEHEAFYASIVSLIVGGKKEDVLLKDMQRHPFKPKVTHVDFLRVKAGVAITVNVPLHFIGEEDAPGMKDGGLLSKQVTEVEISVLPKNLPESLSVDISALELDQSLHLSALVVPEGVTILALAQEEPNDLLVASISAPKEEVESEATESEATEGEAAEGGNDADKGDKADDNAEG